MVMMTLMLFAHRTVVGKSLFHSRTGYCLGCAQEEMHTVGVEPTTGRRERHNAKEFTAQEGGKGLTLGKANGTCYSPHH